MTGIINVLPDQLIAMFDRAFLGFYDVNKNQPGRPDALDWYKALQNYRSSLVPCRNKSTHQYFNQLTNCPWCEAEQREAIFNKTGSMNSLPATR